LRVEIQEGFPKTEVLIKCQEITEEVRSLEVLIQNSDQKLICIQGQKKHLVDKHDILYLESVDKSCFVYTMDEVYEINLKLYELEELLGAVGFFRSAKSQIINIAKIKTLCPDFGGRLEVELENDEKVIISRQYAKIFKERIGLK
jgi:DNA-binding LytR/AlgR family response regulator